MIMATNIYREDEHNTKYRFKNFRRGYSYLKPQKYKIIGVLLLSTIAVILSMTTIKITEHLFNTVIPDKDSPKLIMFSLLMFACITVAVILTRIKDKALIKISLNLMETLRNDLFNHLLSLPNDYFDSRPKGKILVRLTNYVRTVAGALTRNLIDLIIAVINFFVALAFMLATSMQLTLISFVGILIVTIVFGISIPITRRRNQLRNNKESNMIAYTVESVRGVEITQAFNREEINQEIYAKLNEELKQASDSIQIPNHVTWYTSWQASEYTELLIYVVGMMFLMPSLPIGTIIAMGSYSYNLWGPVQTLFFGMNDLLDAIVYLERLFELLDEEITIKNKEDAVKHKINGNIEFKNVSFSYNKSRIIIDDFNLKINKGEKIAIVGKTGSGKTTIVSLLERFYDVDEGSILVDGIDIRDTDLHHLRKNITMMLQDNFLFAVSIKENLRYGNSEATDEQLIEICRKLGIHDYIMSLENGYDTILKNNGKELSDGQRQLLSYARTIVANPKIIIFDEATSKIDLQTEDIVMKAFKKDLEEKTIITIAHRLSTIVDCDKIIVLDQGKIIESGSHRELMNKEGAYYRLYTSQNSLL